MNRFKSEEFFHIKMASRADTALDKLNHIIDTAFSNIERFEPCCRYSTLQSLYMALDHQLQDGLMDQQQSNSYYKQGKVTPNNICFFMENIILML